MFKNFFTLFDISLIFVFLLFLIDIAKSAAHSNPILEEKILDMSLVLLSHNVSADVEVEG